MTIRVRNNTGRPVLLHLQGRPVAFDLVVRREDGTVVWRRLQGAVGTMILQLRPLAPGETLELRDAWRQRAAGGGAAGPGDYRVTGVVLTDGAPLEAPAVPLRILPPQARP